LRRRHKALHTMISKSPTHVSTSLHFSTSDFLFRTKDDMLSKRGRFWREREREDIGG
jgi:hypothetical protein